MNVRACFLATAVALVAATVALAEREPQPRKEADLVVVGKIHGITSKDSKFFGDGVRTDYTAEVVVTSVERGKGAKIGEKLNVRWFAVTKSPGKPPPGAYGHKYKIKADDIVRFWLKKDGKDWTIIYNSEGVEKVK
jgi:hypothetical protein